jgi:hypothetical protein
LTVFFDATGTSSSTTGKPFSHIQYKWDFGDTGASGTGKWAYGSNPGGNSKNTASGAVAAHVYVTNGADQVYTVTLTAFDGTNSATCQMGVTAYDPSGANGYAGSATTCVSSSGLPAAGLGGCPLGARVLNTSSYVSALGSYLGNGKRVLFKCGDTFTGAGANITAVGASIGAYGGCQGTSSNRPILRKSGGGNLLNVAATAGNLRIADLAIDGSSYSGSGITTAGDGAALNSNLPYQVTILNVGGSNMCQYFAWIGPQWALVNSTYSTQPNNCIGVFSNYAGEQPFVNGTIPNIFYTAIMGNSFDGGASTSSTYEVVRVGYMRQGVIENNTLLNAGPSYAVLKLHQANTNNSNSSWIGYYTELNVISDNYFGGKSGANLVEVSPQNAQDDERLRNIVVERNLFKGTATVGNEVLVSGVDIALRDNIFNMSSGTMAYGAQVTRRGIEPAPTGIEAYNNSCFSSSGAYRGTVSCIYLANSVSGSAAQNTLAYFPSQSCATIANNGSGNTVSNNTSGCNSANPGFTNASGSFSLASDFRPTANYSAATSVPVFDDFFDTQWLSTWGLGAVHH